MADQVLQEIKDRLNVADIISGYIQIKKAGANFKALCPFHSDKNPSLMISPQKQVWHCFACGEGGDVFGFVMRYENVDFKEALKILAQKAGVQLPQYRPENHQDQSERELLLRINDFAARYYYEILIKGRHGAEALEYLKNRGLTDGTIKKWQIGFAPDDFHTLELALAKKKVSVQDLVKAGVSAKNERGQMYDRFRGRITFPIYNYNGEIVGFSARILNDDGKSAQLRQGFEGQAKYVNSPETIIYSKSKILFGLNFAKNSIRKKDEAVIVEGQMDCIAAHQAGFENVVASSGTALTAEQLTLLGRLTKNLKFCFDADAAGQTASRRAGELALKQGFRLKVIVLAMVKDPDELIKKSPGLWEKAVSEAVWFLDWQMDFAQGNYKNDPVEQKHFLSQAVMPLLAYVADPLEQDHYVRKMAERFNISEKVIREEIKKYTSTAPKTAPSAPDKPGSAPQTNVLEKEVLGGMLVYPDFKKKVLEEAGPEDFMDLEIRGLAEHIRQGNIAQTEAEGVAKEAMFMVESQRDELGGGEEQLLRQLDRSLASLKLNGIKRQQQELSAEIKRAETSDNKELISKLTEQFAQLSRQRIQYEKLI